MRDWSEAAASQGMPAATRSRKKRRNLHKERAVLIPCLKPHKTHFGLLASKIIIMNCYRPLGLWQIFNSNNRKKNIAIFLNIEPFKMHDQRLKIMTTI